MVLDKNLNTVIAIDFETTDETPFNIRVTSDDQISILDVVEHVTKQSRAASRMTWQRYLTENEGETSCDSFKFKGRGQNATPVTDVQTILTIIMNLPGKMAQGYRRKFSSILIRVLGGDETLHDQIDANAASTSGVAQLFQRAVVKERDEDWKIARAKGKKMLKERQDVMKQTVPKVNRWDYKMANNRNNQIVGQFSCTTKQEKVNRGLQANKPLADDFNDEELMLLGFANAREKRKLRECPEEEVSRKKLKGIIDEVEVLVKPLAIAAK
jgi:hypothetical protein